MGDYVFFVSQVGATDSPERQRADDVHDGIVAPVAEQFGMPVRRADRDPTPGQVTTQIVRALLEARIVVADLTGRNPNVYYELGVAHAFQRPVVVVVDKSSSLSFDTQNEKVVEIGDTGTVGVRHAANAKERLADVFRVVLGEEYVVENLLTSVAAAQSLDALAPDNPLASEVAAMREQLEELHVVRKQLDEVHTYMRRTAAAARSSSGYETLRGFIEEQARAGAFARTELLQLSSHQTSETFDRWVEAVAATIPTRPAAVPGSYGDEEPF